jgi:formylglycine-generating enzyme required for sulfatase activity
MKTGIILCIAAFIAMTSSCVNVPSNEKTINYVPSMEAVNKLLSGKGLFLRFRKIIPRGETREYRGMFLTGYSLSETEVSQHDYRMLIGDDEAPVLLGTDSVSWWDHFLRDLKDQDIKKLTNYGYGDDFPIYGIHKYNAMIFCNRLSTLCGLEPIYTKDWNTDFGKSGFRLPSETQWEYAAGGPDHTRYSLGDEFDKGLYVFDTGMLQSVNKGYVNGFGLFHMSGNVREWCQDLRNYTDPEVFPQIGFTDPVGYSDGQQTMVRGGCFLDVDPEKLSCTYRLFVDTNSSDYRVGMRVCLK